jgi:GT2 family glycosyltransferase
MVWKFLGSVTDSPTTANICPMKDAFPQPVYLSASVVLYNSSPELLQRTLESLHRSALVARAAGRLSRVSVEVVDNSSDTRFRLDVGRVIAALPQTDFFIVNYSCLPDNRGFGAGHNSVMQALASDIHLVLNPDAELAEDALCVGITSLSEDDGIALVSPRVSSVDGRQEFLCKRYPSVLALMLRAFAPRFVRRIFRSRLHRYEMRNVCNGEQEADVLLATGCFMLIPTAALRAVGGFDDDYFLYFEDFDLSLRLGGQGRLVFNPAMQIVHHGGYAARKGFKHVKYFIKSGITFFNQHGWRWI